MNPTLFNCTQQRLFCWRAQSGDLRIAWDELKLPQWDSPGEIVKASIKAQLAILTGYRANPKTNQQKFKEALTPGQAAISLTGEPTLYGQPNGLIETFHKRGLSTFLVSNGAVPTALTKLQEEPSQLHISACAPTKIHIAKYAVLRF